MIGVYKITNPIGQIYIGASSILEKRISAYSTKSVKSQRKIYESLVNYGIENHQFDILEECFIEDLSERERYWQEFYNVLEFGLNCVLVKTKTKPQVVGEETKRLNSESCSGEKHHLFGKKCPEHAEKLRGRKYPERGRKIAGENNCMFGKTHSEDIRKKISEALKGKMAGENNPMYGKKRPEVGDRNSLIKGKKIINTETKEVYMSAVEASKKLGIALSTVKRALHMNYAQKYSLKYA